MGKKDGQPILSCNWVDFFNRKSTGNYGISTGNASTFSLPSIRGMVYRPVSRWNIGIWLHRLMAYPHFRITPRRLGQLFLWCGFCCQQMQLKQSALPGSNITRHENSDFSGRTKHGNHFDLYLPCWFFIIKLKTNFERNNPDLSNPDSGLPCIYRKLLWPSHRGHRIVQYLGPIDQSLKKIPGKNRCSQILPKFNGNWQQWRKTTKVCIYIYTYTYIYIYTTIHSRCHL